MVISNLFTMDNDFNEVLISKEEYDAVHPGAISFNHDTQKLVVSAVYKKGEVFYTAFINIQTLSETNKNDRRYYVTYSDDNSV